MFKKGDKKPPGSGMKKGQTYDTGRKLLSQWQDLSGRTLIEDIYEEMKTMSPRQRMAVYIALLPYTYKKMAPDITIELPQANPERQQLEAMEAEWRKLQETKKELPIVEVQIESTPNH